MKEFSDKLYDLIFGELAGLNLTAIRDRDEFYHKQIIDSVVPWDQYPENTQKLVQQRLLIDIGFGGGFPLLPTAYKFPQIKVIGFEARRKKVDAVNLLANKLGLDNVQCFHKRIEEVEIDQPATLTLKAVGPFDRMLPLIRYSAPIKVGFYKGPNWKDQENWEKKYQGFDFGEAQSLKTSDGSERYFITYNSNKKSHVPRGTLKNIAKISSFI